MKAKIIKLFGDEEVVDLDKYVSNLLDDNSNRGALESIRVTTDSIGLLFGRLIDILATNKVLSDDDLRKLLSVLVDFKEIKTDILLESKLLKR